MRKKTGTDWQLLQQSGFQAAEAENNL